MKDWIKVLIAALTGTLVTLIVTSIWAFPSNVDDKFEAQEIKIFNAEQNAIKTSKSYTDKEIKEHKEETDKNNLLLMKYLDNRFDNLEKMIDNRK